MTRSPSLMCFSEHKHIPPKLYLVLLLEILAECLGVLGTHRLVLRGGGERLGGRRDMLEAVCVTR
jgi:hypothetical protein